MTLSQALARLDVKDAKIEELSDQMSGVEKKLVESNELVAFFRSNQTDEYKVRLSLNGCGHVSWVWSRVMCDEIFTL